MAKEAEGTDRLGRTPLHFAAKAGKLEAVNALIAGGADIDAKTSTGETPLYFAAGTTNYKVVTALRGAGADIHAVNSGGATPLHNAARVGTERIIAALLDGLTGDEIKACVDAKTIQGDTPLHCAAKAKFFTPGGPITDVVGNINALKAAGADFNAKDKYGKTPLHHAAAVGKIEIVSALLANGADINAKDDGGKTPLDIANENKHPTPGVVAILTPKTPEAHAVPAAVTGLTPDALAAARASGAVLVGAGAITGGAAAAPLPPSPGAAPGQAR